ncbi:NAD(P)/FAD-dependent oxidoreductase [Burkholderia plantarii]|uniref:NAD(P)/FAD-dependent oxidoreductase n=1 Tax=Burkholderia plantarii TaxID=41899 RepID=UPI000706478A|nr:FAD-dependent oxidoreductase [Burkholderia plantarii]ALK30084.1 initial dioxygenase reductase subunit [Burkholderia plantarii]GLZ23194.1 ferredoxin reductase [Burkholderia plantarii]
MKPHYVIVGASAAGVGAAFALRQNGFDGDVTLVSAEQCLPYERPAVSKDLLLTGQAPLIVPEATYTEQRIDLRLNRKVEKLDVRRSTVVLDGGKELRADKILLATGGRVRRLQIPGGDLHQVHYVRDAGDAETIREGLKPGARVTVIGGGLIGAEVTACAIRCGCEVDWIESGDRCLTRALSHPLDQAIANIHQEQGVRIHTKALVTQMTGDHRTVVVELSDGRRFEADMVLVGVGIVPAVDLAHAAGAVVDNGIVVDGYGATSLANVYAAGDVARHQTRYMSGPGRLEHWRYAHDHGVSTARSMLGLGKPYDELPWFWTDQYEHHVEGCGLSSARDETVIRGDLASGRATVFYVRDGRLAAASTLNRPNDVRAAMRLIARGLSPSIDALRDPGTDLRKLEKELAHEAA